MADISAILRRAAIFRHGLSSAASSWRTGSGAERRAGDLLVGHIKTSRHAIHDAAEIIKIMQFLAITSRAVVMAPHFQWHTIAAFAAANVALSSALVTAIVWMKTGPFLPTMSNEAFASALPAIYDVAVVLVEVGPRRRRRHLLFSFARSIGDEQGEGGSFSNTVDTLPPFS